MSRLPVIVAIGLLVSGAAAAAQGRMQPPLAFADRPDGSKVAIGDGDPIASGIRCWPLDDAWDCLVVDRWGTPGESTMTTVTVRRVDRLPQDWSDLEPGLGYRCFATSRAPGWHEEIIGKDGKIASHSVFAGLTQPWGKAQIDALVRDNGIVGRGHFACSAVLDAMAGGSWATLGGLQIDRPMLGHLVE